MKGRCYIFTLVVVSFFAFAAAQYAAPAHTFHTSLMQVEYNEKEKLVEISLQVFTHDLENALSRRSGKDVKLDKTKDASQLTLAYLNKTINLKNRDGQFKTLSWVGMESRADAVWIYIEANMAEGFDGVMVSDRIFFEVLDDQVNRVHIKHNEEEYDLVFKPGDDFKALTHPQRPVRSN